MLSGLEGSCAPVINGPSGSTTELGSVLAAVRTQRGVQEVFARSVRDLPAALGFALFLPGPSGKRAKSCIWIRCRGSGREAGALYGQGLFAAGLEPSRIFLVTVRDLKSALKAAEEGAGTRSISAVVLETMGEAKELDLKASRRLSLAARRQNTPVIVVRTGESPSASAAMARWGIRAVPSRSPGLGLPGSPAVEVELLKYRFGVAGRRWRVEWDHEEQAFLEQALSGPVVPLSFDRPFGRPAYQGRAKAG